MIWVCIVCRKKQELLSKTGQWINKGLGGTHDSVMSKIQADLNQQQFPMMNENLQQSLNIDKRPKLERAHSAAEKENLPLQRSNSQLRRQYSQQEQSTRTSADQQQYQRYGRYQEEDPRFYRAELEDLMRSAPYYDQTSQDVGYRTEQMSGEYEKRNIYPELLVRGSEFRTNMDGQRNQSVSSGNTNNKKHKRTGSVKKQHGSSGRHHTQIQRSFSSSDDDLRSPECTSGEDMDNSKIDKGEFVFELLSFSLLLLFIFF